MSYISECIWGGGVPDRTAAQTTNAGLGNITGGDVYQIRPIHRPLNDHLAPGVSWDHEKRVGNNPERVNIAMELPDVFKCPSDKTPDVPTVGQPNLPQEYDQPFPTWEYWGTSYPNNWYWPYYFQPTSLGKAPPYSGAFATIIAGKADGTVQSLQRELLKNKSGRWASEFILFYENQLNYQMANAKPKGAPNSLQTYDQRGWHGKMAYHIAGFLDGHSQYRKFDAKYIDGPSWTIWPNKPWLDPWKQYEEY
jgi:hypothetical protein